MYKIGAIIVTYNCDNGLGERIKVLDPQVQEILIIDNNSTDDVKLILNNLSETSEKLNIIYNSYNSGIAHALNQGIKWFSDKGYDWVVTLDHDSVCEEYMINNMLIQYDKLAGDIKTKVAVLAPEIYDLNINSYTYSVLNGDQYELKRNVIQSGTMFNLDVLRKIGLFNENLFIYYVDDEMCERLLQNNYHIIMVKGAILYHEEGEKVKKKFIYREIILNNYSGKSLYYIIRNALYMHKKYRRKDYIMRFCTESTKVILFDSKKIPYIFKGVSDFLRNVTGAYID